MKMLRAALICVLALGVTSPALFAQSKPDSGRPQRERKDFKRPPPLSQEEREKIRVRLGITVSQQEQMDKLFENAFKRRKELNERLRALFEQRRQVCDVYDYDRDRERALRAEIQKVYEQTLAIHATTEDQLRRLLNREQFEKLRALREEGRKKFSKGRRPRGGPPD